MQGQGPGFIPALGSAQGFRARTSKGLKARLHFSPCARTLDRAFSPLPISTRRPRPSLVPRFDLGWYGLGRWPSIAHYYWKGMKVPLQAGARPLRVLGAFVVKHKRRCGVDRGGKFCPKCDVRVPQCSVQRGASSVAAWFCGVQRLASSVAAAQCSVQRSASGLAAWFCGAQGLASSVAAGRCSVQRGASSLAAWFCGVHGLASSLTVGRCSVQRGAFTATIHSFSTLSSSGTLVPPLCEMPLPEVKKPGAKFTMKTHKSNG